MQNHDKKMKAKATEIRLLNDKFETKRKILDKNAYGKT